MPQYLAPGVYVEELAGPRTIQGVGTSTAAFVGPCRFGPVSGRPELLTSYLDFERVYGDALDLAIDGGTQVNYLALAVQGFFDEGGSSLYVQRVFAQAGAHPEDDHGVAALPNEPKAHVRARFPGAAGNMMVTFTLRVGRNALVDTRAGRALSRVRDFDTVWAEPASGGGAGEVRVLRRLAAGGWELHGASDVVAPAAVTRVLPLTVLVDVARPGVDSQGLPVFGAPQTVGEFGFDVRSAGGGVTTVLNAETPTRTQHLTVPIALEGLDAIATTSSAEDTATLALVEAIFGDELSLVDTPSTPSGRPVGPEDLQITVVLSGGVDGLIPGPDDYAGISVGFQDYQHNLLDLPMRGLVALESLDDVSIVAAPGASSGWLGPGADVQDDAQDVNSVVIAHCERMRYRVAALDTPPGYLPNQALEFRNLRSSDHAALYYPWIVVTSPVDGSRVTVPPAGYMAGIWARTDATTGVFKAPANEVIRSALDLESRVSKAQQELLNPEGVDCLRFFPGPGFLVWGARTISNDPQWKYLSTRRYFNYLEKSIEDGTDWVVFQVNNPALWGAVRRTVEGFLLGEWKSGALLGTKPEEAYFVTCDASTMTQDDLDNGRLICRIGVAVAKPAEFVIFRISQWTATPTT